MPSTIEPQFEYNVNLLKMLRLIKGELIDICRERDMRAIKRMLTLLRNGIPLKQEPDLEFLEGWLSYWIQGIPPRAFLFGDNFDVKGQAAAAKYSKNLAALIGAMRVRGNANEETADKVSLWIKDCQDKVSKEVLKYNATFRGLRQISKTVTVLGRDRPVEPKVFRKSFRYADSTCRITLTITAEAASFLWGFEYEVVG